MNHKHYKSILLDHFIVPKNEQEIEIALKLVMQKEKFILEDSVNALTYNKSIKPLDGTYTLQQYIHEINKITNQYYFMYIQISQFEAFLRTYINHAMIKVYGEKWHQNPIMQDLDDFKKNSICALDKPSKALNSISFGTLELVFLNGSRYINVFHPHLHINKILAKDGKPKYKNKDLMKGLFSIVRNARNDICHHRRIGESMRANPKYSKKKMSRSDVMKALTDLKVLLDYDDQFDVQAVHLEYKKF